MGERKSSGTTIHVDLIEVLGIARVSTIETRKPLMNKNLDQAMQNPMTRRVSMKCSRMVNAQECVLPQSGYFP